MQNLEHAGPTPREARPDVHCPVEASLYDCLRQAPWARRLAEHEFERVACDVHERRFGAGALVAGKGELPEHWLGVLHGLVKIDTNLADGRSTTFIAVAAGGWLGEGSLLKREPRPYEVTALQDVRIACMPRATFHWLYERSLAFNQFLVGQMNARLAHFIALLERARVHSTSELVAFGLASLLDAAAPPGTGDCVRISQEELGRLCGVSRQVTARGLHRLQEQGVIRAEYGVIQVRDPAGLRSAAGIGA